MRYELKSIPFWPVLKVGFFVNLVVGLLVGILYAMFLIPFMAVLSNISAFETGEIDFSAAPLGLMIFILPVITAFFQAFFGTLFCVVVVLIYNLAARLFGGLELNLEEVVSLPEPVASSPLAERTPPQAQYGPPPAEMPPPPPPARPEPPPKPEPGQAERGPDSDTENLTQ